MKRMLACALAAAALTGCGSLSTADSPAMTRSNEMRMAFDITDTATPPLINKLETIETTRKQLLAAGYTPRIVIAFRGNASYFTQTQAQNLMPEVKLVPNGWIALAEHQRKGYAYIAP